MRLLCTCHGAWSVMFAKTIELDAIPSKKKIPIYVGTLCQWFLLMHTCGMTVSSVQAKDIAPSVFVFGTHTRLKAFI